MPGKTSIALIYVGALVAALALGCSARVKGPGQTEVVRITLEETPLWTAAAAWSGDGQHLILLDPGSHRLLTFDLQGRVIARVELDAMATLDYSTPIRLHKLPAGYLLGDKTTLLRLDDDLAHLHTREVFAELAGEGIEAGTLNDFVVVGEDLYGYVDFRQAVDGGDLGEAVWHRGFARLGLGQPSLFPLLELALEDGEFTEYYFYDRRPYISALGRRVFVLRHTDPVRICAVTRRGLSDGWPQESEGLRAVSLFGWKGRLYLLLARRERMEEFARLVEQGMSREEIHSRLGIDDGPLPPDPREWILVTIDSRNGKQVERQVLPTQAERLHLVPGDRYWALIQEASGPNSDGESAVEVVLFPSILVEEPGLSTPAGQMGG